MSTTPTVPLRERSRARRSRAIHLAGMRLFAEQGYDATTVAEIAAAAEVSPRTVASYYPSKLDIALASTNDAADRLGARIRAASPDETLADLLVQWVRSEVENRDEEVWTRRAEMFAGNPSFGSGGSVAMVAVERLSLERLASELSLPVHHPAIRIMNGAFGGIILQFALSATVEEPEHLVDLAAAAFRGVVASMKDALAS